MRTTLLCLTLLFILSCKTKEQPVAAEPVVPKAVHDYSYDVDTLASLDEYIPLFSERKLYGEHYCYTVISHVNVVDVKAGVILADRTVVLHDNVIEHILSAEQRRVKIKRQYRILEIDGTGKYLAPGLCDMHTHYLCSNAMRLRFLVNGVTSVRNAEGTNLHLDEQRLLLHQQLLGPNCYSNFAPSTGPWVKDTVLKWTPPPSWLYIHEGFQQDKLQSVFTLAESNALRVSIDSWEQLPEIKYPQNTAFEQWTSMEMLERQSNFGTFWFFSKFFTDSLRAASSPETGNALLALKRTPGQFCMGTETQPNTSWSECPVVSEMKFLTTHAVPKLTAIQIATRNAGMFVNSGIRAYNDPWLPAWFGEVKEGYRADLVLLGKNPLIDVANYAYPQSVFVKGVYLSATDLTEMNKAISKLK